MVKEDKKGSKIVKKEEKKEKKIKKKTKKELNKISSLKKEAMDMRYKRYVIQSIIAVVLGIILLVLLCNRTFFREEYKTSKIDIDIPMLTYFVSDENNQITLITLRKSEYVRKYFSDYLTTSPKFVKYDCGGESFYYDSVNFTAIYDIAVEKNFALKTIKIRYRHGEIDKLCAV